MSGCYNKFPDDKVPSSCNGKVSRRGANRLEMLSLDEIVQHYRENAGIAAKEYRSYYSKMTSLEDVIHVAAMADYQGKRHSHQRRIPQAVLEAAAKKLKRAIVIEKGYQRFSDLFADVEKAISTIHGVGPLMIYDTAHRIGLFLKLRPEDVYLHAGSTKGARVLGLPTKDGKLSVKNLNGKFQPLRADEIEDCLCIYKDYLERLGKKGLI